MDREDIERFWRRVDKRGDCWIWTGAKDLDGYGQVKFCGKIQKAHRVSLEIHGKKPNKRTIHLCGNHSCVNPDHVSERTPANVFKENIQKTDGCWKWLGAKDSDGYGIMTADTKPVKAHRYSYEKHKGHIPEGMWVLHTCDNPECTNPDHLYIGTNKENVKDRMDRKRQPDGERHPDAKMTIAQVRQLREKGKTGTYKTIGEQYGLSIAQTAKILNRQA